MKDKIKKLKHFYEKLTFLQGIVIAISFSSLISIAATNLPGFIIFSAGTPISSSEINSNFEKLAGSIVFKGSVGSAFSIINPDFTSFPDCLTCNSYRQKLLFDNNSITDENFKVALDSNLNNSSYGQQYSYYQVSSAGWYEIRFLGQTDISVSNSVCSGTSCSHGVSGAINLYIANSLSGQETGINSMWMGSNFNETDSNFDGVFDNTYSNAGPIPEIKRIFLKVGQIIIARFDGFYNQTNATADYTVGYTANSVQLTIIKL